MQGRIRRQALKTELLPTQVTPAWLPACVMGSVETRRAELLVPKSEGAGGKRDKYPRRRYRAGQKGIAPKTRNLPPEERDGSFLWQPPRPLP